VHNAFILRLSISARKAITFLPGFLPRIIPLDFFVGEFGVLVQVSAGGDDIAVYGGGEFFYFIL